MNWFSSDLALQRILTRQLGAAYSLATPRLSRMGAGAATEGARLAQQADQHGPKLVPFDRTGARIDDIEYHPSYRQLQQLGYGGGIVAATWNDALRPERGQAPKALTFGLGYLYAQGEAGLYCPMCMTDGTATLLKAFGTEQMKREWIPRLGSLDVGNLFTGAMFLTEKSGGSDVGQVQTVAKGRGEAPGDAVTLWGDKWFCSNVDADLIMILARPEGAQPGTRGLGLYALPRMLDGQRNRFRINRLKDKLGNRSFPSGEVTLEGATAYLLGGPGQGFAQMADMLNLSRVHNAVASVALMRRCVVEAMAWAETRVAFGQEVVKHPLMTETMMDMVCEQRVALNWAFSAVERMDRLDAGAASDSAQRTLRLLTPLLKYVLGRWVVRTASDAVEALGGNGYIEDWPLARVYRDAQVLPIWEGTTNVLVLDAFRALKKTGFEVLAAELERLLSEAPTSLQGRMAQLFDEVKDALPALAADPRGEHAFRDWTDRVALLWLVGVSCSRSAGYGTDTDVRAASRVLSRWVPERLLRSDRATVDEVRAIAWT